MKKKTTKILVNSCVWHVPRGFGRVYRDFAHDELELAGLLHIPTIIGQIRRTLERVGYTASTATITNWPLRQRVEARVWASIEHARASDNPIPRHPPLPWLEKLKPWQGAWQGEGAFAGPTPTEIPA